MHPPRPNPFNPRTVIRFELASADRVNLVIYDVAGRRVRTLLRDQLQPRGVSQIEWDGRDELDRPVASGVYLVRMRADSFESTRRVTLLK